MWTEAQGPGVSVQEENGQTEVSPLQPPSEDWDKGWGLDPRSHNPQNPILSLPLGDAFGAQARQKTSSLAGNHCPGILPLEIGCEELRAQPAFVYTFILLAQR